MALQALFGVVGIGLAVLLFVVLGNPSAGGASALTGTAIAELDGADLAAARAEALGHIRAYSRRQRPWFRKLRASRVDHRTAVKIIVSRLQ